MAGKKRKKRLTLKKKAELEEMKAKDKNKIRLMTILAFVFGILGGATVLLAIIFLR